MKYMVIDIGSNTVKYTVFSYKDKVLSEVGRDTAAVKLISCIDEEGRLSEEGLERLCSTLALFVRDARIYGCKKVCAAATASLRRVKDRETVLREIEARTGIRVRLLDGEEEARCSLTGLFLANKRLPEQAVMIDMGGGSTELHFFRGRSSLYLCSLPFGALSLKRSHGVGERLDEKTEKEIFSSVQKALSKAALPEGDCRKTAALVGGTAKACGKLIKAFFGRSVKEGVDRETFLALCKIVCDPDEKQAKAIRELAPDRYEILSSGLTGYAALFEILGTEKILFCKGGLREGYLACIEGKECVCMKDKGEKEEKKAREAEGKEDPAGPFVFEGMISLRALLDAQKSACNDRKIEKVLYAKERLEKNRSEYLYLTHRAEEFGFEIELRLKEELSALAAGGSHGGVLALCSARTVREITAEDLPDKGFFVAMEGIEDPYNFGYALRSIYAAGADGVLFSGKGRYGGDGTICRSSAGASERLPVYTADPAKAAELFKKAGYRIVCADMPHSKPMYDVDLTRPLLLVVGGEKRGISGEFLKKSDAVVRIDYGRDFDAALSAASASAVLAFEVFRQNRKFF